MGYKLIYFVSCMFLFMAKSPSMFGRGRNDIWLDQALRDRDVMKKQVDSLKKKIIVLEKALEFACGDSEEYIIRCLEDARKSVEEENNNGV